MCASHNLFMIACGFCQRFVAGVSIAHIIELASTLGLVSLIVSAYNVLVATVFFVLEGAAQLELRSVVHKNVTHITPPCQQFTPVIF